MISKYITILFTFISLSSYSTDSCGVYSIRGPLKCEENSCSIIVFKGTLKEKNIKIDKLKIETQFLDLDLDYEVLVNITDSNKSKAELLETPNSRLAIRNKRYIKVVYENTCNDSF